MLSEFYVDGFRSLRNFSLKIRPGLNVLVGPNGSGKTNILLFLEFISYIYENTIIDAVSRTGGASNVFDRAQSKKTLQELTVCLRGASYLSTAPRRYRHDRRIESVEYQYRFKVNLDKNSSSFLFYKEQEITLKYKFRPVDYRSTRDPRANKDESQLNRKTGSIKISFNSDEIKISRIPSEISTHTFIRNSKDLRSFFKSLSESLKNQSILTFLSRIGFPVDPIISDLNAGKAFNIAPNAIRAPEDIATEPTIRFNGSGLAATLLYLHNQQSRDHVFPAQRLYNRSSVNINSFRRVIELAKIVNNNILDITPRRDVVDNKIVVEARFKSEDNNISIPLNYLSDGTLKWLALVTAIINTDSLFSIEEPENFLHPQMQIEFVSLVRSVCKEQRNIFAILTTHSETLINTLSPEEIVVTAFKSGYTEAKIIEDRENIKEQINETGFGLGWFYITGALND